MDLTSKAGFRAQPKSARSLDVLFYSFTEYACALALS